MNSELYTPSLASEIPSSVSKTSVSKSVAQSSDQYSSGYLSSFWILNKQYYFSCERLRISTTHTLARVARSCQHDVSDEASEFITSEQEVQNIGIEGLDCFLAVIVIVGFNLRRSEIIGFFNMKPGFKKILLDKMSVIFAKIVKSYIIAA